MISGTNAAVSGMRTCIGLTLSHVRGTVPDSFDVFDYVEYLRRSWRVPVASVLLAAGITAAISFALPKKYTAAVSILIEPPGVNDVRVATAVTPVYLESLKSYERFGASDSLFAEAVRRFELQDKAGNPPIEALKRRVLRVAKPRDTRILELSVTLPDPQKSHDCAVFLAERTVAVNRTENIAADKEILEQARAQVADASKQVAAVENSAAEDARLEHPDSIDENIRADLDVVSEVRQDLIKYESLLAEYSDRARTAAPGEGGYEQREVSALKARTALLRQRLDELTRTVQREKATLSARTAQRDQIQSEKEAAEARLEVLLTRLHEAEAVSGSRGERLR